MTLDDMHVNTTGEEQNLLDPSQKNLCNDVMLESNLSIKDVGKTHFFLKETNVFWLLMIFYYIDCE